MALMNSECSSSSVGRMDSDLMEPKPQIQLSSVGRQNQPLRLLLTSLIRLVRASSRRSGEGGGKVLDSLVKEVNLNFEKTEI